MKKKLTLLALSLLVIANAQAGWWQDFTSWVSSIFGCKSQKQVTQYEETDLGVQKSEPEDIYATGESLNGDEALLTDETGTGLAEEELDYSVTADTSEATADTSPVEEISTQLESDAGLADTTATASEDISLPETEKAEPAESSTEDLDLSEDTSAAIDETLTEASANLDEASENLDEAAQILDVSQTDVQAEASQ